MKPCMVDIETLGKAEVWDEEGRIVCIGVRDAESTTVKVFLYEDEKDTVQEFVTWYRRGGYREIVGFNLSHDLRFIQSRCLRYEIPAGEIFSSTYTDLMTILWSFRGVRGFGRPGKMNEWAQYILGKIKLSSGASVKERFEKGQFTQIMQYCKEDVHLTYDLWARMRTVLGCQT